MNRYSLTHLSHGAVVQGLKALVVRDRTTTAELLAHIAEVDLRRVFLPAGYPSMFAWCVAGLGMSEDCAGKHIQVARAGRKFPALFEAIALGRLHLTGAGLLAPHLTEASASELISSAMGRTKLQVEQLIADRFPKPDLPERIVAIPATSAVPQHAPAHAVLEHAFDAAIEKLEKRKLGATSKPRAGKASSNPRYIPARVKRAVAKRDGNRCAFVGDNGKRCEARRDLEFDHILPVAQGGESTVANLRLLCRPHNQLEAERSYGDALMKGKRERAAEHRVRPDTDGRHSLCDGAGMA